MLNKTDEQLMLLIKDGNERAFGILVKRYLPKALFYTDRIIGINSDDIVQDSFLAVWKNAYSFNQDKALFKTWFYTILKHKCYNNIKKEKSFKTTNIENFEDLIQSTDQSIEEKLIIKQENNTLQKNIKNLNKREQEVINLRYFEEKSNKETSLIMQSSVQAIETLLHRAKAKLRKNLK
jgi:RNA polymerase sigma-70 factor, ECF subfamily